MAKAADAPLAFLTILRNLEPDKLDDLLTEIGGILSDYRKGEWKAPKRFELTLPS